METIGRPINIVLMAATRATTLAMVLCSVIGMALEPSFLSYYKFEENGSYNARMFSENTKQLYIFGLVCGQEVLDKWKS